MSPFEFWWIFWATWLRLFVNDEEVRALRNCHNTNAYRLDRIEAALRNEGISG
jgi:hypothetical protein